MLILIEKTPKREEGRGWIRFLIFFFKHNKFKQRKHKYKEIRLEEANSDFIMVRHPLSTSTLLKFLTEWELYYTWSFNQASNTFTLGFRLQWPLTQSFQVSTNLKLLTLKWKVQISQPSSTMTQIQFKTKMNHKGALKNMQMKIQCTKERMRAFKVKTSR